MKKTISFLLVILLLAAITGCGEKTAAQKTIVGSWETKIAASILGVSVPDNEEAQSTDATYCFNFSEDGSGTSSITLDAAYAEQIRNTQENFTYTLDGEQLTLTFENGNTQVFTVSFSDGKLILDGRARLELMRTK